MYLYPYQIIKKRLSEIQEIKDLNWYLQQYEDNQRGRVLYNAPGVYIQFEPIITQQLDKFTQMAESVITIHLVTDSVQDNEKRIATTHTAVMDKIYGKMHGFSAKASYLEEFAALAGTPNDKRMLNSMRRSGITPPHSFSSKVVTLQQFHSVIYDHSKNKVFNSMAPGIEVNGVLDMTPEEKLKHAIWKNSDESIIQEIGVGVVYTAPDVINIDSTGEQVPTPAGIAFAAKLITHPRFAGAELADDNTYVDLYFTEAEYNTALATGALEITDFNVSLLANGGDATGASISSLAKLDGSSALEGGEIGIRAFLSITGTPSGVETITIAPVADSIFDADGNTMDVGESVSATLNQTYQSETIAYRDRVVANGGALVDIDLVDGEVKRIKNEALINNLAYGFHGAAGYILDNANAASKQYSYYNNNFDLTQLTASKQPIQTSIVSRQALEFSQGQYIEKTGFGLTQNYSIEIGFYIKSFYTDAVGLVKFGNNATGERRGLIVWNGGSGTTYYLWHSLFGNNIKGEVMALNTFYKYVVTFDSLGNVKIYKNGTETISGTHSAFNVPTSNDLVVGATLYNSNPEYLDGYIAYCNLYDKVLSPTEIANLNNGI
jgi:hypothetical protein